MNKTFINKYIPQGHRHTIDKALYENFDVEFSSAKGIRIQIYHFPKKDTALYKS